MKMGTQKLICRNCGFNIKESLNHRCSVVFNSNTTICYRFNQILIENGLFKYVWYWKKNQPSNLYSVRIKYDQFHLLKNYSIFSDGVMNHENLSPNTRMFYYPQNLKRKKKLTYKNRIKKVIVLFKFRPKAVKQGGGKI
jgi:hypothetical protein